MRLAVVVAAVLAACGGPGEGDGPDADPTAPDADPNAPDADPSEECDELAVNPAWLDGTLSDAISRLSGASQITPGVTLSDRATPQRRGIARDWLEDQLTGLGLVAQRHEYGTGVNIYARLPGSDPSAGTIVVGAHYDSWNGSPGANDNASGTAVVLAAARLLRDTCRRAEVLIVFLDQEEIGLVGATAFATMLFQSDEDVIAVHTVDQAAWDQDNDRRFEIELPGAGMLAQYQAAAGALGLSVSQTSTSTSDHQAFRERGFPSAGVTEEYVGGDTTDCYHLACDVFADVELAYTADAVALVSRVVNTAAQ